MKIGRIIKSISGEYTIVCDNEKIICKPRGLFRYQGMSPKVGDIVSLNEKTRSIMEIKPRKNDLVRPFMSNIDKAFAVFSVKEPDLNLNLLDRMLAIFEFNDIETIIVFTKLDLLDNKDEYLKVKKYYQNLGYSIYESSRDVLPVDLLKEVDDNICVLTGQSGVGKSTLLNGFDQSLDLKTSEISQALGRGKHTTRHIELIPLAKGYLADTPGFGMVSFDDMDVLSLSQAFREFFLASKKCKYGQCLHINEPNCEVKNLLEKKEILESRYKNYLLFVKEIEEKERKGRK